MVKLFGGRIASALVGISVLGMGSSASAQDYSGLNVQAAVKSLDVDASAAPLGNLAATLAKPVVAATNAVASATGAVFQTQPAQSVTVSLRPSIATEAAWLYKGGWPLYALVQKFETNAPLDTETNCLATAVYFEARGESLEGQLAVAHVVMNRAASGRYPPDWCSVVKQPAQFSFVQHGQFPQADTGSYAWYRAMAIARIAARNLARSVPTDVLWYHASYVAPRWKRNLTEVQKIGTHIFYRA